MKQLFAVIALFATVSVYSQTAPTEDAMESQINRQLLERPPSRNMLSPQLERPNEIKINGLSYSGIIVQAAKTDNPLQLINPAAPPEYGSPEDNTARDPVTGKVSGLKLFSIRF